MKKKYSKIFIKISEDDTLDDVILTSDGDGIDGVDNTTPWVPVNPQQEDNF